MAALSIPPAAALKDLAQGLLSRLDFAALLDQRGRMLKATTALPQLALIPERVVMREAVSQPFELVLDALSTSAHFELKRLVGEQVSVQLLHADGRYRAWHGYVTQAFQLGADGGLARYRLVMAPWTAFAALRRDARIFQDRNARQILEAVFAGHPQAQVRFDVGGEARSRSLCTQYRESDFEFACRLMAEEGWSFHFEHLQDEAAAEADKQRHARHVLVIADRAAPRADLGVQRFTSQHPTAQLRDALGARDAITAFAAQRRLAPNAVTLAAWDYKRLAGTAAETRSTLALGELPALEQYDGSGAYRYADAAQADERAALALAALELQFKRFEGQGSARVLRAGAQFRLVDHPLYGPNTTALNDPGALLTNHPRDDNQFTVLAVEHHASNNLGANQAGPAAALPGAQASTPLERGTYKNHFHCAPAAAAVVPRYVPKPTAPGAQTALVVGVDGEALTTERDHRVKIQFAWQRGERPNAGGLADPGTGADGQGQPAANAPGNERSGTWVRVAEAAAGANWGSVFTPRIGAEVLVQFVEGDIDRPLVVAQLYNGADTPPFAAGVDSGANHPGVISGIHSQGLDGGDFNQWVIDDATGQLRMRLLSSYTMSELGLGHLIQQGAAGAQRGAWRGAGFEAGTQGWATLRAAKGLLISTSQRPGTYGSAQSTQMDSAEALAQLKAARDLAQRLSQAAAPAGAMALAAHDEGQSVPRLLASLDPKQQGKLPPTGGQEAMKLDASRQPTADPVEAYARPAVVIDSASALVHASDADLAHYAGQDLTRIAQGDVHEAAAHTFAQVSGEGSSVYTHDGQLQIKAANGPVSLRAHTDRLEILADQSLTFTSVNAEIRIQANRKIELVAGDSGIVLEGGNVTFTTPGAFEVKGSGHAFLGGGSQAAELTALPVGLAGVKPAFMELNLHDEWLQPVPGAPYVVVFEDGTRREGVLDANGHARLEGVPNLLAEVFYGEDPRPPEARVAMPANTLRAGSATNEEAIANIERAEAEAEKFWAEQATAEQREQFAEFNAEASGPNGENLWHYLDEAQQKALEEQLRGTN